MAEGPISCIAIDQYCINRNIFDDDYILFKYYILAMDKAYLEYREQTNNNGKSK